MKPEGSIEEGERNIRVRKDVKENEQIADRIILELNISKCQAIHF